MLIVLRVPRFDLCFTRMEGTKGIRKIRNIFFPPEPHRNPVTEPSSFIDCKGFFFSSFNTLKASIGN